MTVLTSGTSVVTLRLAIIGRTPGVPSGGSRKRRTILLVLALSTEWAIAEKPAPLLLNLLVGTH